MRLLIATQNVKKRRELELLLAPLAIEVVTPSDVGGLPAVEEDQPTFALNAAKKAVSAARARKEWALADDSGLEVDALGGAPGVRSARWAGEPSDDGRNNAKLLRELEGLPDARRGARFVCALALARPDGTLALEVAGEARGRILHAPRGDGDFGYDPCSSSPSPLPRDRPRLRGAHGRGEVGRQPPRESAARARAETSPGRGELALRLPAPHSRA
jgi:XTP/dITP diphosphohydrolase